MRWNVIATWLLVMVFILYACKKEHTDTPTTGSSLLEDGPLSPVLGKRIHFNDYGNTKFGGNIWGRDYNELFISAATTLLRLDLLNQKIEVIENSGGLFTGKTNENSGAIFVGTINGKRGYYEYHFATHTIESLLSLSSDQVSDLHVAGNTMIFYSGILGPPSNPCTSPWDFWCSNSPAVVASSWYHVDKLTKQLTPLPHKTFVQFSKDGTKSLFNDTRNYLIYAFDNVTRTYIDSIKDQNGLGATYYDTSYTTYQVDHAQGQVVAVNVKTNEVKDRFSVAATIFEFIRLSKDGSTIFYKGVPEVGSDKLLLGIYNMQTKQDKVIATLSVEKDSPWMDNNETILSNDGKRLLVRYVNDLYIKDID